MKFIVSLALLFSTTHASFAQEGSLFKSLLTGAGIIGEKPAIDYKERPPLVVPKNTSSLPEPVDSSTRRSAAWPQDPDVQRKKREKEQVATGLNNNNRGATTREEMDKGWLKNAPKPKVLPEKSFTDAPQLTGGVKPGMMTKDADVRLEFKGEGERTSLTQPPSGYRTPSAAHPFGPVGKTDYTDPSEKKDKK
jgi:hypothetical protein